MKKLFFIFFTLIIFTNISYASFPVTDTVNEKQDTLEAETVEQYHLRMQKMGFDINDCRCNDCKKFIEIKAQEKSISQIEKIQSVEDRPLNNISLNLLGDASRISINYEKQYLVGKSYILSAKVGLGYNQEFCISFGTGSCSPVEDYLTIPHHFTANIGKRRSFFEFGLGGTILSGVTSEPYILYGIIGYRFLPFHSNKFNFRIYLQLPIPIKEIVYNTDFPHPDIRYIPFGVSAGISF